MSTSNQDVIPCPSCGQTIDVEELQPGTAIICPACGAEFESYKTFGHYRLEELVGEGGMGSVYRAIDVALNRVVAVKVLKAELSSDEKFIAHFLHEVEITASLSHPNIVNVFSFGEISGSYYLVMEFISHRTLDDLISEHHRIGEMEALNIGIAVSNGLNFALVNGNLIHRDIKPGNILFGPDNTPKVVDFGLAISAETVEAIGDEVWGTPYYISPERLEAQKEDFRSDMYSLGVSLYHAVAGRPPFDARTAEIVAAKHLSEKPLPLKTHAPHVTDETSYAIMKAMARYPQERYQSYEEFIQQLEDCKRRLIQSGGKVVHKPVIVEEKVDKTILLIIGILTFVIATIVIGLFIYFRTN